VLASGRVPCARLEHGPPQRIVRQWLEEQTRVIAGEVCEGDLAYRPRPIEVADQGLDPGVAIVPVGQFDRVVVGVVGQERLDGPVGLLALIQLLALGSFERRR
jgi:hypothetical protein